MSHDFIQQPAAGAYSYRAVHVSVYSGHSSHSVRYWRSGVDVCRTARYITIRTGTQLHGTKHIFRLHPSRIRSMLIEIHVHLVPMLRMSYTIEFLLSHFIETI